MTVLWAAMTLSLIISKKFPENDGIVEKIEVWLFGLSSLYFVAISLWRTFILGDKGEDETRWRKTKPETQSPADSCASFPCLTGAGRPPYTALTDGGVAQLVRARES